MNYLKLLRERKKKKLRDLNLSDKAWVRLGEIYSHTLINHGSSLSNEEIVESCISQMHKKIVREGGLRK